MASTTKPGLTNRARPSVAAVLPGPGTRSALRPLDATDVAITGGYWADRQAMNRTRTLHHGYAQLEAAGALHNLRLAAGAQGTYKTFSDTFGYAFPFLDTDVYKWLEAVGWELGRAPDASLAEEADGAIATVAAAQRPDGYLNSYVQVVGGGEPFRDLAWGHEFYCIGHLVQAAIAWHRGLGDDRLLDIARRAVDQLETTFGAGRREGIEGHPEIEMALVELWRTTGERRYLAFAEALIERRGHGLLGTDRFGSAYWQDHLPVRSAPTVAGHAVRQLYLDAGAVDAAVELGDDELLAAVERRWEDMVATRSYLTGGLGARHRDESFGDPFELPPDEAYAETCASIASVLLAWRLLLATGRPRYADAIERTVHNGVLSGLSLDGTRFFYVNPLQRRKDPPAPDQHGDGGRQTWYPCACCPPNLMRLLSSWEQYLATLDDRGVSIQQFATASLQAETGAGRVGLTMETDYPWDGRIAVTVSATPDALWTLSLRIPSWCRRATITDPDGTTRPVDVDAVAGAVSLDRAWRVGDRVVLELDMPARVTHPDPRVEATRGCVAFERGPIVYCLEAADLPPGIDLEAVAVDDAEVPVVVDRPDLSAGAVGLRIPAVVTAPAGDGDAPMPDRTVDACLIPYALWANRELGPMRVWIPVTDRPPTG
jgi:DUF1680 family protein